MQKYKDLRNGLWFHHSYRFYRKLRLGSCNLLNISQYLVDILRLRRHRCESYFSFFISIIPHFFSICSEEWMQRSKFASGFHSNCFSAFNVRYHLLFCGQTTKWTPQIIERKKGCIHLSTNSTSLITISHCYLTSHYHIPKITSLPCWHIQQFYFLNLKTWNLYFHTLL